MCNRTASVSESRKILSILQSFFRFDSFPSGPSSLLQEPIRAAIAHLNIMHTAVNSFFLLIAMNLATHQQTITKKYR